jgi:DNA-directed RNA polymerase specialized sigma24 family protein
MNRAEVASILEIPEGTVKSRLFHATQKLKKLLEVEEDEK